MNPTKQLHFPFSLLFGSTLQIPLLAQSSLSMQSPPPAVDKWKIDEFVMKHVFGYSTLLFIADTNGFLPFMVLDIN